MIKITRVHHIAIICRDYERSKKFYTEVLGFELKGEYFRKERNSWKADFALNGVYTVELFSFDNPPARLSRPEATGLRHVAFEVNDIISAITEIEKHRVVVEPIRIDEFTGKKFTFFNDPDGMPIELYER